MTRVLQMLGPYFLLVLTAITVENAVFTRALGLSRLISLVDSTINTIVFGILLLLTMTSSGVIYHYFYRYVIEGLEQEIYYRALGVVLSMSVSFILVFILAVKLMPYEYVGKAAEVMPAAAFNCMVFGTVMLSVTEQMTLLETLAFSIGSAVGYVIAIISVTEGQRKLQSRDIPAAFKGLPATILYLAGLAMAVYGFTGRIFSL